MHQNPFTILALLLTLILFSTCDSTSTQAQATAPTPESLLVKSWKLQKLNIQGEMAPPQIMTTSS
ncbi:MAG TPA: hypothetical protein ENJ82_13785, partial [Bacteroidetes bacterium]|nr:hypothetical protein [Bacteroidota bacterium]